MMVAVAPRPAVALFPRQVRFVNDSRKYPGYIGGIGSGKSFAGAAKVVSRINEPEPGLVIAPTYPMLRDSTQRTLLRLLTDLGVDYRHFKADKLIVIAKSGHEIMLRSADDPDSLRGPNCAYAYVDEAALVTKETWQIVKGRVRVGANPQAWLTGTPKGRNWIWEEWERDATGNEFDLDHPLYRVRTDENPTLPPDFIAALGYTGQFALQELGGQFVAFSGLVYPEFHREQVTAIDCADWPAALGLDFGSRSPTALLTLRHFGDRYHLEREVYRRGMTATEIKAAVHREVERTGASFVVADVNAGNITLELKREGIRIRDPKKQIFDGIAQVRSILPELTVDPQCVNTIAEFESYQYPEGGTVERDEPVKANDHGLDALRYICMELTKPKRRVRFI